MVICWPWVSGMLSPPAWSCTAEVGGGEAVQRHVLGPGAVAAARLEAGGGVLLAQIADGHVLGRGGDAAALVVRPGQDAACSDSLAASKCRSGRGRGGPWRQPPSIVAQADNRAAAASAATETGTDAWTETPSALQTKRDVRAVVRRCRLRLRRAASSRVLPRPPTPRPTREEASSFHRGPSTSYGSDRRPLRPRRWHAAQVAGHGDLQAGTGGRAAGRQHRHRAAVGRRGSARRRSGATGGHRVVDGKDLARLMVERRRPDRARRHGAVGPEPVHRHRPRRQARHARPPSSRSRPGRTGSCRS